MKPYIDENCKCHEIEDQIDIEFSGIGWNMGEACNAWQQRSSELKNNNIEFEAFSDAPYACTCPTCGRTICGWCVLKRKVLS